MSRRNKRRFAEKELFRDVFWPRDLLPTEFPQARIITWGYDVQVERLMSSASKASIFHHAENLLLDISSLRKSEDERSKPLIFIAHSLGGIVVKDALCQSGNQNTRLSEILPATVGVMFLGTPHHGSKVASLGKIAFEASKVFLKRPNLQVLRGLEENSETLERISRGFDQVLSAGKVSVHSFREELPIKGVMIVESASSTIGNYRETQGSLYGNHRTMAKFSSPQDVKFQRTAFVLQEWVQIAIRTQSILRNPRRSNDPQALVDKTMCEKDLELCLNSLYSDRGQSRFENIELACPDTYNWLFSNRVGFEDWLEGKVPSNTYWIQGKPGSGKSTIMKYAMGHDRTREILAKYSDGPWIIAGFFFHDRGIESQKSTKGFLQHILYQIIDQQHQLFRFVRPLFTELQKKSRFASSKSGDGCCLYWDLAALEKTLELISQNSDFQSNLCLFVDGLDEHNGDHRELIRILRNIAQQGDNPKFLVRLVLAGRPENVFKSAFQKEPGFAIHEHTTDDIRQYTQGRIQAEINNGLTSNGEVELRNISEDIVDKAKGVFMWVRLVVNELVEGLCDGDTMEELRGLLSLIPTELEDLYTRALRRLSHGTLHNMEKIKMETFLLFEIITSEFSRKLEAYEVLAALAFFRTGENPYAQLQNLTCEQLGRRLNSRSAGLMEINHNDYKVQFIHQTVNEFVRRGKGVSILSEFQCHRQFESLNVMMYRYLLSLVNLFGKGTIGDGTPPILTDLFVETIWSVEKEEFCIADSFEDVILGLPTELQRGTLLDIFSYSKEFIGTNIDHLVFPYLYFANGLKFSFAKSLKSLVASPDVEDYSTLLERVISGTRFFINTVEVWKILVEEEVVKSVLERVTVEKGAEIKERIAKVQGKMRSMFNF